MISLATTLVIVIVCPAFISFFIALISCFKATMTRRVIMCAFTWKNAVPVSLSLCMYSIEPMQ